MVYELGSDSDSDQNDDENQLINDSSRVKREVKEKNIEGEITELSVSRRAPKDLSYCFCIIQYIVLYLLFMYLLI